MICMLLQIIMVILDLVITQLMLKTEENGSTMMIPLSEKHPLKVSSQKLLIFCFILAGNDTDSKEIGEENKIMLFSFKKKKN